MNSRPYSTAPPGRSSWRRKLAAFGAALALFGGTASAQCTNAIAYSSAPASATIGGVVNLPGCSFSTEYNLVTGTIAGYQYTIGYLSGTASYYTVRAGTPGGAVLGFGPAPVTFTSAAGGDVYVHYNLSAACNGESTCNSATITTLGPPPCNNANAFGTITANNVVGVPQTISTCSYLEEYSTVNGTLVGVPYIFAITTGGYVTVRSGSPGGPVVGAGVSPLTVNSTATTLYPHWNVNGACATETGICRTTQVTRSGAPPPPTCTCNNTSAFATITANNVLNVPQNITTCSYQTEYSTVNGTLGTSLYTFTIAGGGYITVRSGSPGGPVLGCGVTPLQVTTTGAGTLYPHWNTNSACGTATGCLLTTVTYNGSAVACTGTPVSGTVPATFSACSNSPVAIAMSGFTTGASGITFSWEESDDNGGADPWGPVVGGSGATTATYTTPGYTGVRYYRGIATCSNSGLSGPPTNSCMVSQTGNCQFTVARNTGVTYQTIVGNGGLNYPGFLFGSTSTDDATTNTVSLAGTTFQYKGQPVSGFRACTNGWMTFNTGSTSAQYINNLGGTDVGLRALLAPFWDDLVCTGNPFTAAGQNASMQYSIVGVLGSGTAQIIAEWIGMEKFGNPGPNLNYQVILNEAGNTITFRYGTMEGFSGSQNTLWDTSIGLNGWSFTTPASFSDVMALRDEGTTNFAFSPATVGNSGLNFLVRVPECNSEYVFTPDAAYPGPGAAPSAPPANDEIAGAISLPVGLLPCTSLCGTYYTSQFATASAVPACTGSPDDDVWFSFVANAANTNIQVRSGANHNAAIELMDATGTTSLFCVNAAPVGVIEQITATGLVPGTTYLVRVYHSLIGLPAGGRNDFSICVYDAPPPPANDDCAGAIALTPGLTCSPLAGSSLTATGSGLVSCTGVPDDDVWYKFVAFGNAATLQVQSVGTYNAAVQVFSSTTNDCLNLTSIACLNATGTGGLESTTLTGLTPGNTYSVRVYHSLAGTASGNFTICVFGGPQCPVLTSPADAGTTVTLPVALTWNAGQFAATYDVYFDQNNPPTTLVSDDQAGTSYNVPGPLANGLYYWQVISTNALGSSTNCAVRSVNVNIPSCQQPSLISVTAGPISADLSWQCFGCIGTYIVEYGAPGFVPGTGATAGAGTVITSGLLNTTIPGLTTNTPYQVYVRQECNPGIEYSLNTGPIAFTTSLGCGSTFQDNGGGAVYSALLEANPYIRTICPTTAGDKVIVQFTQFRTEPSYDPLYVFDGTSTAAPKIAHPTNGTPFANPNFGTGGWWSSVLPATGPAALANAPTNTGIPAVVIATNPSGCLTFAHISDSSVQYEGWTASVSCATPQYDCTTAGTIACGEQKTGFTFGGTNTLPVNGCDFNGGASTSGVSWWTYTALATEDVVLSTCGTTTMDTRISVYKPMPDCTDLECVGAVDDGPGCPNGTTTLSFKADVGEVYYIAVHGNAANNGLFQLQMFCQPLCNTAVNDNDDCANATPLTVYLQDGNQVLSTDDNSCSYVDGPTTCSGTTPAVGNWFSFTANAGTSYRAYVVDNSINGAFTALQMDYALFDGTCTNLLASGPVTCDNSGAGFSDLPALTPNAPYKLFVYNDGSLSQVGSFGVWVDSPALYDGEVVSVEYPTGTICNLTVAPEVTIKNNGQITLTTAILEVSFNGGPAVAAYNWAGSLATGASTNFTLPLMDIPAGANTITVTVTDPNGFPDEITGNDAASVGYDATGQTVVVTMKTGSVGAQCNWGVFDAFFFPVGAGGPYVGQDNATITTNVCLATTFGNCFYFFVFDDAGDGLVNSSNWELRDSQGRLVLTDNGAFVGQSPSTSPATPSYFAHEFCLPLGPSPIQASECNVFNNFLNNKVYTTVVSGALNYQFEFSDPNAGFYRRISLPRNWVKFGEMVTSPLVFGTTYFCRARADQGASGYADDFYGAGCEMALAPSQPVCTELISTPGTTFSCGVTKRFGGSDKIWAQPVTFATQYRFTFVGLIDPDGTGPLPATQQTRNLIRTSYVCPLNWFTFTLVNGQTYDVSVEAFVGGSWSGYCGAVCQLTIQNPPGAGMQQQDGGAQRLSSDEASGISLWPNPVRDGRVNLMISDMVDATQMISVDVYDAFGKRVMAQQFENAGEVFNQVLDLDDSMAAGLYVVSITVNDKMYVERLNVVR